MRRTAVAAVAAVALIAPVAAHAGIQDELKAANKVEQRATQRWHGYNFTASCDQEGRKFWCDLAGDRGNCFVTGHAWVRNPGWRVQIVATSKSCF